jgi:hypothetical protein
MFRRICSLSLATLLVVPMGAAVALPPDATAVKAVKASAAPVAKPHLDPLVRVLGEISALRKDVEKTAAKLESLQTKLELNALKVKVGCDGPVSTAKFCRGTAGNCEGALVRIPCFPFACREDRGGCLTSCSTANDCSEGSTCSLNGKCAPTSYSCADAMTVKASSGSLENCAPYLCRAGQCTATCSRSAECAQGAECSNGRCVPGKPKKK